MAQSLSVTPFQGFLLVASSTQGDHPGLWGGTPLGFWGDSQRQFGQPKTGSLPTIVDAFKSAVTKRINRLRETPGAPVWQRNYWERIIRDDRELHTIRQYIGDNPARWYHDQRHPPGHRM